MALTLDIDSRGFRRALEVMARETGLPLRQVIRAEAGAILKACAGDTKVSTQARADLRSRARVIRDLDFTGGRNNRSATISVNSGVRGPYGRVFRRKVGEAGGGGWRRTHDANFQPLWQHYRDRDWIDLREAVSTVQSAVARALPLGRAAIGLARQSWVQIADSLGIRLEAVPGGRISAAGIAKARAAIASTGFHYVNGTARDYASAQEYFVDLVNRLPYGTRAGLDRILVKNINARARYFHENMRRGVFDSLQKIARAYPGLTIR